jgi:phosphopantothenoylcysteine decarboxylase/phosphopantothenate--cysteine ligase
VTGSIAIYKALELVRRLRERGALVSVVMTRSAQKLVTALSFESVSGNRVYTDMWSEQRPASAGPWQTEHIDLAQTANLVLVAPATANILGKVAAGIADDLLSTVIMATRAPVLFAPAMNNQMWTNPVVQHNVARLKESGCRFADPERGSLACGTEGPGRLAAVETICDAAWSLLGADRGPRMPNLAGKAVVVTTGRTEEELDPVRVITNRSSGRMGIAIARAARLAGAQVKLIAGKTGVAIPAGLDTVCVTSTEEMLAALRSALPAADVLVMAAAPADFRPGVRARDKRKDRSIRLELERTPDILLELGRVQHHAKLVGFSLESRDLIRSSRAKLEKKNLDLVVANPVQTVDSDSVRATLIYPGGRAQRLPRLSKQDFAVRLVSEIGRLLNNGSQRSGVRGRQGQGEVRGQRSKGKGQDRKVTVKGKEHGN